MEQPIINSNDPNEQLIHPPQNYECTYDRNALTPFDKYYVDEYMNLNQKAEFNSLQIIRTDFNIFILQRKKNVLIGVMMIIIPMPCPIILYFFKIRNLFMYIGQGIISLIFICFGIYLICFAFEKLLLTLDPGSIIITNKARCRIKDKKYNIDEIERAELYYNYYPNSEDPSHVYKIYLIKRDGTREIIHEIYQGKKDNELEGLKYFVDLLNNHIMRNRR